MKIELDNPFDSASVEGTNLLKLDFSKLQLKNGDVIPVAVQNAVTKEVILIAYTNELAFNETLKQRKAVFWSLSRNKLWYKGEESGNTFTVQSIYVHLGMVAFFRAFVHISTAAFINITVHKKQIYTINMNITSYFVGKARSAAHFPPCFRCVQVDWYTKGSTLMGGTKIFVLQMKDLIRIGAIVLAGLALVILALVLLVGRGGRNAPAEPAVFDLFVPGTYSSVIILNDKPVEVRVTVSETEILEIYMTEMAEIQRVFYPLFEPRLYDLTHEVLRYQTAYINPATDYPVTTGILQRAVKAALERAAVGCCCDTAVALP